MSAGDGGPVGRREVAYRLFAAEYDDADLEYSDSEEERAPNYVITPTGARVNRLFAVGVLTEVEPVSDDVLRARVVDPTGAFVVYAGQYQPEAVGFLEAADVPSFVAVTGKARTFRPEGSDRVFTSVRPESVTAVDAQTRDRWTVQAAEHTLARVATMARALAREARGDALAQALREEGVAPGLAAGISLAIDHYGTTTAYLSAVREQAIAALEVVAGDRQEVPALDVAPDGAGPVTDDLTTAPPVAGTLAAGEAGAAGAAATTDTDVQPVSEAPVPGGGRASASGAVGTDDPDTGPEPIDAGPDPAAGASESGGDSAPDDEAPAPGGTAETDTYELDEAEREAVEAEYGTEFSPGTEVDAPGEAGIESAGEPPDTETPAPEADVSDAEAPAEDETESAPAEPGDAEPDEATEAGDADTEDSVDLEDAAVAAMADLDEGDGADREAVVEAVAEAHGADPEAVDAAIQEALMSGRCYEPSDGRLKAI